MREMLMIPVDSIHADPIASGAKREVLSICNRNRSMSPLRRRHESTIDDSLPAQLRGEQHLNTNRGAS